MNELHLFAGAGGGILAGQLLGHRCVCAVEFEPYAQAVLVARQNDGTFPPFPIWDEVRTFDGKPWRGLVDVVCGGFPCQDISAAGNGAGIDGERSGLWREMARIVSEVRPKYVFVENSPLLVGRGLAVVIGDLAELGYDAQWFRLSASDCGAPHQRDRLWLVANAGGRRLGKPTQGEMEQSWRAKAISAGSASEELADSCRIDEQGKQSRQPDAQVRSGSQQRSTGPCSHGFGRWPAEPGLGRVVDGMAHRSHRLKAIGNGQVSRVAAAAFAMLAAEGGRIDG
ncbi:MAG: DNA cytosine methyltransferase [Pseudomonadales bacterium 32-61-5]|nr:MAG: DNA cytosine methyltransferase [Pseudomonadales bacterium 32-61-5]